MIHQFLSRTLNLSRVRWLALSAVVVFSAACEREDGITTTKSIAVNVPDNFARYINNNAGLPSGDYTIVVATFNAGESGSYTLTVAYDDGTEEIYNGSWTASGGQDPVDTANDAYDISLASAGGLTVTLESDVDNYLYLLRRPVDAMASDDRTGWPVFAENDNADTTTTNAALSLASSNIDSESFGKAYYDTIDPTDAKTTLEDWKVANGYYEALAAGRVVEPRFRDTKDLGYGRGMRAWVTEEGEFFSFVENFQVRTSSGNEYTDLNLDALVFDIREHHFGSNAIEYSAYPYGPGDPCSATAPTATLVNGVDCRIADADPPKFNKFFTFDATQGSQTEEDHDNETRLNRVNLDGRGNKAMPGSCVYCHGGTIRPLRADGSYRDNCYDSDYDNDDEPCNGLNGDTNAKLQLLEVDSFAFWQEAGEFEQSQQEPLIKRVNLMIYCTYPGADADICATEFCPNGSTSDCDGNGTADDPTPVLATTVGKNGQWSGNFATEMAEGWYDGDGDRMTADWGRATFDGDFVPVGWMYDPDGDGIPVPERVAGQSEDLFLDVVQPICFVCHSRRGTNLGTDESPGVAKDIDFSSYERFISHADQIKEYVFDRGVMPLSLRGYNAFWEDSSRPLLLASVINANLVDADPVVLNADGEVDQPGAIIADAGPDRTTPSPVRLFASSTRFADSYSWQVISTPAGGEAASLSDSATARPVFTAPVDGDYVVQLTASNTEGDSATDIVNIKINSAISKPPAELVFADIVDVLENDNTSTDGRVCVDCHQNYAASITPGVPVFWTATQPANGVSRYEEVLARVDFEDPANSLMLMKPAGNHHYGRQRGGFDVTDPSDRANYDLFLNWILEGARFDANNMREP